MFHVSKNADATAPASVYYETYLSNGSCICEAPNSMSCLPNFSQIFLNNFAVAATLSHHQRFWTASQIPY